MKVYTRLQILHETAKKERIDQITEKKIAPGTACLRILSTGGSVTRASFLKLIRDKLGEDILSEKALNEILASEI